jgi:hypothetical protein
MDSLINFAPGGPAIMAPPTTVAVAGIADSRMAAIDVPIFRLQAFMFIEQISDRS